MRRLYFLHIPRTSGTSIGNALVKTFSAGMQEVSNGMTPTDADPDIYSAENFMNCNYISGHYAKNPIVYTDGELDIFSIIREPVDHFVSVAAYAARNGNEEMSDYFMDEFLYGHVTPFGANELFSNSGNLQSKMLFCRIATADGSVVAVEDSQVVKQSNVVFIESDMPDEQGIKEQIAQMNLFLLSDRKNAIEWLRRNIYANYGLHLDESIHNIVNPTNRKGFTPDPSHVKEIIRRTEIDQYVYRLVTENMRVILG